MPSSFDKVIEKLERIPENVIYPDSMDDHPQKKMVDYLSRVCFNKELEAVELMLQILHESGLDMSTSFNMGLIDQFLEKRKGDTTIDFSLPVRDRASILRESEPVYTYQLCLLTDPAIVVGKFMTLSQSYKAYGDRWLAGEPNTILLLTDAGREDKKVYPYRQRDLDNMERHVRSRMAKPKPVRRYVALANLGVGKERTVVDCFVETAPKFSSFWKEWAMLYVEHGFPCWLEEIGKETSIVPAVPVTAVPMSELGYLHDAARHGGGREFEIGFNCTPRGFGFEVSIYCGNGRHHDYRVTITKTETVPQVPPGKKIRDSGAVSFAALREKWRETRNNNPTDAHIAHLVLVTMLYQISNSGYVMNDITDLSMSAGASASFTYCGRVWVIHVSPDHEDLKEE